MVGKKTSKAAEIQIVDGNRAAAEAAKLSRVQVVAVARTRGDRKRIRQRIERTIDRDGGRCERDVCSARGAAIGGGVLDRELCR